MMRTTVLLLTLLGTSSLIQSARSQEQLTPEKVLQGLKKFYQKTAKPDGFFTPGIDPTYKGMSDCAYSDLAAVTYACTVHRTLGWKLPHEKKTIAWLQARQNKDGAFFNVRGTVDPKSPPGRVYNTTQALVALRALGAKPLHNPLPLFEEVTKGAHKELPPYATSFFPLAYLCYGRPIPEKVDRAVRATMFQAGDGYLNNHVAATYHASHYYRLVGEETPKAREMIQRILRDQKDDGSWLLNMPSRDRHATFDAVFSLHQEGHGREDCRQAIQRAAQWALKCRNPDGGFGHFPGSTSDADAIYFHVGTLVMAGWLKPADPLPKDPHLLSWGHLMPVQKNRNPDVLRTFRCKGWVGAMDFSPDGRMLATGSADKVTRIWDVKSGKEVIYLKDHDDIVTSVRFSPDGRLLATGSYDQSILIRSPQTGKVIAKLMGHRGPVMSIAFSPDGKTLASGSVDRTIRLWDVREGVLKATLSGDKSWVNALRFTPDGQRIVSGSSDGTVKVWSVKEQAVERTLEATDAEVRSIDVSPDGKWIVAGIRYGMIKTWSLPDGKEHLSFQGHPGDVWTIRFSPDGKTLASGNGDWNRPGKVKLWDAKTGRMLRELPCTGEIITLCFSPDGKSLATGGMDRIAQLWDLEVK